MFGYMYGRGAVMRWVVGCSTIRTSFCSCSSIPFFVLSCPRTQSATSSEALLCTGMVT